ncbi:hypothetical protein RB614_20240 [Phytohabitans sp. ZYX-F-186]|uniref:Uncharacterized protein n=1 Tax=Phytohabitans maris TaxID=3071409 RepID=A0ABU0ZIR0_9ACTN|nr:hypothetical protein [Phytohabitans sp. ZYX-F-186]MDQ7906848.1 hypothetical protein [Phytohabitans sp. ZYX-F-186]
MKERSTVHFSELYAIERTSDDDWFDPLLLADTNLCVDPFLIYPEKSERWRTAHDHILDFFGMVFGLVRDSGGNEQHPAWLKASRLLMFPEPPEFCLGVAETSPMGSGTGRGLQEGMLEGVRTALGLGMDNLEHMEMLALFQGGMGLDRISDAVCNILKSYFIEYTQEVCRRHGVPMETFRVRNAYWSEEYARWQERDTELPVNPFVGKRQPVLLVPYRFLKDIPVVTANAFWTYAWANHAADLRGDFNFDLAQNVDRRQKAKMARQNPDIVAKYLLKEEEQEHRPYPVDTDPKMRIRWWELGGEMATRSPLAFVATEPAEFPTFVKAVLAAFQHGIEHQGDWQMLWYRNIALPERKVQLLFRSSATHYCRANEIDISGEANAGRGPVDFKFSQGWSARAVVEIKLMNNTKFWHGLLEQTPQYAISEEVKVAFFVAIGYTDEEMSAENAEMVERAAKLVARDKGIEVIPIVVDARRKDSASKLKADKAVLDELRQGGDEPDAGTAAVA